MRIPTLISCSILCLVSEYAVAAEADVIPKCLNAWSSGYWTGWHHVELVGDILLYWNNSDAPRDTDIPQRITPSLASWRRFRQELDAINVWCWHADYSQEIFDATAWRFQIDYSDRSLNTGGDGGIFPKKDGTAGDGEAAWPYPTEPYLRYVKAVRVLLGSDTFPP
jgi:hypothetical protein